MIIAIDGPAAAGKGTLARRLAAHFGLPHLDTGLLYRAVGRRVLDAAGDPTDPTVAEAAALRLHLDDLGRCDLRGPEADDAASKVAAVPGVRAALLDFQRAFAPRGGAVLDGRDIGTVIFPDASAKLFVTASVEERGRRRWNELTARGVAATLEVVTAEIAERDAMDRSRATAPLVAAADAVTIDTSSLSPDEAFERAVRAIEARLGNRESG